MKKTASLNKIYFPLELQLHSRPMCFSSPHLSTKFYFILYIFFLVYLLFYRENDFIFWKVLGSEKILSSLTSIIFRSKETSIDNRVAVWRKKRRTVCFYLKCNFSFSSCNNITLIVFILIYFIDSKKNLSKMKLLSRVAWKLFNISTRQVAKKRCIPYEKIYKKKFLCIWINKNLLYYFANDKKLCLEK